MSRHNSSSSIHDKRELFESQLRSLQSDIGELSQKLSIPIATIPTGSVVSDSSDKGKLRLNDDTLHTEPKHYTKKNVSFESSPKKAPYTATGGSNSSQLSQKKAEVVRLGKDLRGMTRERDDLHYRHEQLKRETNEMKKGLSELGRLRALCDNLQQDNDSLKMSLESSEKIRKQQKELIVMMQRSTQSSISGASISSSSLVHQSPARSVGRSVTDMSSSVSSHRDAVSGPEDNRDWLSYSRVSPPTSTVTGNGYGVPATYLASPAVLEVMGHNSSSAAVGAEQSTRTTRKASTGSGSGTKATTTKGKKTPTKRLSSKLTNGSSSGSTKSSGFGTSASTKRQQTKAVVVPKKTSKSVKTKKAKELPKRPKQASGGGVSSSTSLASQSTNGVYSFDHIMSSGIVGSPNHFGRSVTYFDSALPQQQRRDDKPPRPPRARPTSANAALRPRSGSNDTTSTHGHGRDGASRSGRRGSDSRDRGRDKITDQHDWDNHLLRSRSLTPDPVSLSQFNLTHSPYRSSQQHPQPSRTYMQSASARR